MKTQIKRLVIAFVVATGLAGSFYYYQQGKMKMAMHKLPAGFYTFKPTDPLIACGKWRDTMPKIREEMPYRLYYSARRLWRSKPVWTLTQDEASKIVADVQSAAARGDWGAKALLAYFYRVGFGPITSGSAIKPDPEKSVEIIREAIAVGQAWGFYDLGVAYENGFGGIPYSLELAWAYYRQAAILGSPDAQVALAQAYGTAGNKEAKTSMYHCAYVQEFGPAAYWLGRQASIRSEWMNAIKYYQDGVKYGDADSAMALHLMFSDDDISGYSGAKRLAQNELGIHSDPVRAKGYEKIFDILEIDKDLKLRNLDRILPLPPAVVPEWSGILNAIEPEPAIPTYER